MAQLFSLGIVRAMKNPTILRFILATLLVMLACGGMLARPIGSELLFSVSWLGLIIMVGLEGVFFCQGWLRVVLWLLAAPPLCVGLLALSQGGIAEPFSTHQMWIFCTFAFWPAVGCTIGEFITHWRHTKQSLKSEI